ncbi:MAG: hypothetical protein H0V44_11685 [Planctomycetes bacterium]|nr:hypothetical protein [Planctomycetota bacterium]
MSDILIGIDIGWTKTMVWGCGSDGRLMPPQRRDTPDAVTDGLFLIAATSTACAASRCIAANLPSLIRAPTVGTGEHSDAA